MSGGNFFSRLLGRVADNLSHAQAIQNIENRNKDEAANKLLDDFLEQHTHHWSGNLDLSSSEPGCRSAAS